MAKRQIWVAYNHVPGGNICAAQYQPYIIKKRMGDDKVEEIHRTAEEQIEGLRKQPNVALYVDGKIEKNKIMIYPGDDLLDNPHAADVVIAWAISKGLKPIPAPESDPTGQEKRMMRERMESAELRVTELEKKIDAQSSSLDQILALLKKEKVGA